MHTGYVDTALLLDIYKKYLQENNLLVEESFDSLYVEFFDYGIQYKNIKVRNVIFAEGFGLHKNAFFNYLPLDGTKGELFLINAPNLKLDVIFKKRVFIFQKSVNLYKVCET